MLGQFGWARMFGSKVLVSNLPKEWTINEISSRYGVCGQINSVQLIKNAMGQNTGKAIVEYTSEKNASEAIKVFDNKAVDDVINFAKPVFDKGEQSKRKDVNLLARRVYLMNVPYDAHHSEIKRLVETFAEV